jgi:hypothetical protein
MKRLFLIASAAALLASPALAQFQGSGEQHRDLDSMGLNPQRTIQVPVRPEILPYQGSDEEHRDLDTPGVRDR